jgi:hypothetical protein
VIEVDLPGTANDQIVNVINEYYHPLFSGGGGQYDIAILELADELPPEVDRYEIYLGSNELFQVATRVGFGSVGARSDSSWISGSQTNWDESI